MNVGIFYANIISLIFLYGTFGQYRVKLFPNIFQQFIVLQFGQEMNEIRPWIIKSP